jgi:hypothetical protein
MAIVRAVFATTSSPGLAGCAQADTAPQRHTDEDPETLWDPDRPVRRAPRAQWRSWVGIVAEWVPADDRGEGGRLDVWRAEPVER